MLALDLPSGLDADTGACGGPVVQATHTATFIALKPGLLTADGVDAAGKVTLHDLGIDARAHAPATGAFVTWPVARQWLHRRRRNTHKGSFGTLGIVGGAAGMAGAALLAGRAALFAGAGKVKLGFLVESAPSIDFGQPELMLRTADEVLRGESTALVVGPGAGQSRLAADHLGRALSKPVPMVLDADALNLLALEPGLAGRLRNRGHPTLLTPHPAEAARLLQTSTAVVQADRLAAAASIAERFNAFVALKGAGTVCDVSRRRMGDQRQRQSRAGERGIGRRPLRRPRARCWRKGTRPNALCCWGCACTAPPRTFWSVPARGRSDSPHRNCRRRCGDC